MSLTLQEKLKQAQDKYRDTAIVHMDEQDVKTRIEEAKKSGSDLKLLNNIFLAHNKILENKNVIMKAQECLDQKNTEMRNHRVNLASLKAERKQKAEKVLERLSIYIYVCQVHILLNSPKRLVNHVYAHFCGYCVQIVNKQTEWKVVRSELTALARRTNLRTQERIDELRAKQTSESGTDHEQESFAKEVRQKSFARTPKNKDVACV